MRGIYLAPMCANVLLKGDFEKMTYFDQTKIKCVQQHSASSLSFVSIIEILLNSFLVLSCAYEQILSLCRREFVVSGTTSVD